MRCCDLKMGSGEAAEHLGKSQATALLAHRSLLDVELRLRPDFGA